LLLLITGVKVELAVGVWAAEEAFRRRLLVLFEDDLEMAFHDSLLGLRPLV